VTAMSRCPGCTCGEMCLGGVEVYLHHDGSALLAHASDALDHHVAGSHVYEGRTGGHQGNICSWLVAWTKKCMRVEDEDEREKRMTMVQ
jgi:hypothetical protein